MNIPADRAQTLKDDLLDPKGYADSHYAKPDAPQVGPAFVEGVNGALTACQATGVQCLAQMDWEDGTYLTIIVTPPGFKPGAGDFNPETRKTA